MRTPLLLTLVCAICTAAAAALPLPDWVLPVALCATLAALLLALRPSRRPDRGKAGRTGRPIAVDGSNVLYWKGDAPHLATVADVLLLLEAQGRAPKVWFDANVGYLVAKRYLNATELAKMLKIDPSQVVVAPKGEPADPLILEHALRRDMQILSNDRFRDWQERFPAVTEPGRLLRGQYAKGQLRLDPAFAPKREAPAARPASPLSVPGERRATAQAAPRAAKAKGPAPRREPRF